VSEPEQLDLLEWLAAQPPGPSPTAPELAPAFAGQSADSVSVHLTRVDPSCNMRRFYSLALAVSLFGECGVVRRWGRIGSSGRIRTDWYEDLGEAKSALRTLCKAKYGRGYGAAVEQPSLDSGRRWSVARGYCQHSQVGGPQAQWAIWCVTHDRRSRSRRKAPTSGSGTASRSPGPGQCEGDNHTYGH
jgi:predicted DNA-binding WGR domain protein